MTNEAYLVFMKRSSGNRGIGGRGEYELVGESAGQKAANLIGKHFRIHLHGKDFRTQVYLTNQGGKPRLRLDNPNDRMHTTHVAGLVASLLMLPSPCRSESKASHALPVLQKDAYLLDVACRLLNVAGDTAVVEPVLLIARSGVHADEGHTETIIVSKRVSEINEMLNSASAEKLGDKINSKLLIFKHALENANADFYRECKWSVDAVMDELPRYNADYLNSVDPLPFLRSMLRLYELNDQDIPSPEALPPIRNNFDFDKAIQRRQRAERWYRRKEGRGASAARFARSVMRAYDRHCVICGLQLPKIGNGRSGIEAAHILPWAEFDMDIVPNGLALCRNHHWAFDNRVLSIVCQNESKTSYMLVPGYNYDEFEASVNGSNEIVNDLGESGCRQIDDALLPSDTALRPTPDYLERFNGLFVGTD